MRMRSSLDARTAKRRLRVFYCGDIHGSDVCFRKFINAGAHYEADVLILGGDITGKALVPIVRVGEHGWRCYLHGQERIGEGEEDLAAVRMAITHAGFYPIEMSEDDLAALERDKGGQQAAFRQAMIEQVRAWTELAAERLKGTGRVCLVMPGNDDEYYIDDYLGDGEVMRNVDGQVVRLSNGIEVLSLAWSNATPWNSAREFSEEEIGARLEELCGHLERPEAAIFNTHVPPSGTGIDTVQKLDDELQAGHRPWDGGRDPRRAVPPSGRRSSTSNPGWAFTATSTSQRARRASGGPCASILAVTTPRADCTAFSSTSRPSEWSATFSRRGDSGCESQLARCGQRHGSLGVPGSYGGQSL